MKASCSRFAALMAGLLLAACGGGESAPQAETGAPALTRIVLQADWFAEPEHGGFYQALLKGYYREAGLDVEIQPILSMISTYAIVGSGSAQMGLGTSDNLLIAMSQGIPLKAVFPYFQHDPQGVMFHKESGITTLEDLNGRTVMISPILHYVDFLDRAMGIRMNLIPLDGGVARFVQDKQFVQQAFLTSEPWAAMQGGAEPQLLPFWDTGYDPYRLVFTSESFAREHPEAVKAFIEATLRGWESFLNEDREDTYANIMERNPSQNPEFMAWTFDRMQEYSLGYGHAEHGETLGQFNLERLRTQVRQLEDIDLLGRPLTAEDMLLPELYPPHLVVE